MGPAGPAHLFLPVGLCVCTLYLCTLARHCKLGCSSNKKDPCLPSPSPVPALPGSLGRGFIFGPKPFGLRILFRYPHSNGNRSLIGLSLGRITD